tara:strand:+ start:7004 stop:7402 length:399 start_codon:yes stop_codon:yes gene_type:complete
MMGNTKMFFKRTLMPALIGMLMIGSTSVAYAQAAKMSQGMAQFRSAAQELVTLYNGTGNAATMKAMSGKIAGAMKRKADAASAIEDGMKKLDPKSQKDGRLAEKIFGDMQAQNKAVADAHLAAIERIAKSQK